MWKHLRKLNCTSHLLSWILSSGKLLCLQGNQNLHQERLQLFSYFSIHKNEAIEARCLQIYIICVHFFSVLVHFVVFWCNTLSLGKWKLHLEALPALHISMKLLKHYVSDFHQRKVLPIAELRGGLEGSLTRVTYNCHSFTVWKKEEEKIVVYQVHVETLTFERKAAKQQWYNIHKCLKIIKRDSKNIWGWKYSPKTCALKCSQIVSKAHTFGLWRKFTLLKAHTFGLWRKFTSALLL